MCIFEHLKDSRTQQTHSRTPIHHIIIAELAFCYHVLVFTIYDSAFPLYIYFSHSLDCSTHLNTCHFRNIELVAPQSSSLCPSTSSRYFASHCSHLMYKRSYVLTEVYALCMLVDFYEWKICVCFSYTRFRSQHLYRSGKCSKYWKFVGINFLVCERGLPQLYAATLFSLTKFYSISSRKKHHWLTAPIQIVGIRKHIKPTVYCSASHRKPPGTLWHSREKITQ